MNSAHHPKFFLRLAALALAGGLAMGVGLRAADAPTDASATPPPPPPPAPAGGTWYVFSPPKDGVVLAAPMREKMLMATKTILDRSNPEEFAKIKNSDNPFYPKVAPPPETAAPSPGIAASPAAPASAPQVTEADKLQQIADQLKPSGALIVGQTRLIAIASGDTLAVGQTIQVTFPGDNGPTAVVLQGVTSDNFTLKMGGITKTFPYVAKAGVPHSNPAPTPPPPKP